jgi:hypothetical protein
MAQIGIAPTFGKPEHAGSISVVSTTAANPNGGTGEVTRNAEQPDQRSL